MRAGRGEARVYFEAHVNDVTDECMLWPYATTEGYGVIGFWVDGKKRLATVTAMTCEVHYGPRPHGAHAAHGPCHTPRCWNWQHLSWKTPVANADDKRRDGTHIQGSGIPWSKLTEATVREIRQRYAAGGVTYDALGFEYGVDRITVCNVVLGRSWRHVD